MKFDCDQCGTRYNIADEKVRRKVLKIRCRVCEHVITVRGADLERQDADEPAPQLADGWFAAPDGEELGPMPLERLQGMVEVGEVGVDTLVWCEGMPDWIAVGAVPELVPHLPKTSSLDEEATSTFEVHDRIDDSLRRTLLSTPPPRSMRPEPPASGRREGIGWETPPEEQPKVAEQRIGPLVPGAAVPGGDRVRHMLVTLIVLGAIVLLVAVGGFAWWLSQPPGQRPGLRLPGQVQPGQVQPGQVQPGATPPAAPAPGGAPPGARPGPSGAAPTAPPAAAPETLTPEQVRAVIAGHKGDIETCRNRQGDALPGREGVLAFDLRPSGRVNDPRLDGPLSETAFAGCLKTAARGWRFPVFTGDPIPVQYPFELSAR